MAERRRPAPAAQVRDSRRRPAAGPKHWHTAELGSGEVHKDIFQYVQTVEHAQFDTYNRFVQLEALYDPNSQAAQGGAQIDGPPGLVIENVIASNVDTVTAQIATTEVRPRVMTDDGDWSMVRTAELLEWYAEQLGKKLKIHDACRRAFKSAAKKGTGIVKVFIDQWDEVRAAAVRIDDIIVDEAECRNGGKPRQMHRRMMNVDRGELKAMFPEHAEAIDRAQKNSTWRGLEGLWAGYRPLMDDGLVVLESHKLPTGRKGKKGYVPGRHTICIDGVDLLDEEWHKPFFPYACVVWSERETGFFGISLSEGIAGIQRALNKRNLQIDRGLDQGAFPTTYVGMADAHLAVQTINRAGTIVPIKGQPPVTVTPPAVHPEAYQSRRDLKDAASENSGVSRMSSQAVKPAGIESAVGLREYRDQTTQRFAPQEQDFEQLVLHCTWLALDCCKDLGEKMAPKFMKAAKFGSKEVPWDKVDLGDVEVQLVAASTLGRGPAGRRQEALEMAQAGVIDTDEYRDLIDHPDIDRVLSMYTQARKSVEADIEAIRDGHSVTPEPFGNLKMMARMGLVAYQRDRDLKGCPEEVLEALRDYTVLAEHYIDLAEQAANSNMAMPGADGEIPAGAAPAGPSAPPAAALSSQAMQLVAS